MTATALLAALRTKGVHLTIAGEHLAVDAPKGVLTEEVRQAIRQHKQTFLALLAQAAPAPDMEASTTSAVVEEMVSINDEVLVDDDAPVETASVDGEVSTPSPIALSLASDPPGTLHHIWSTVLQCAFWVMETDTQTQTQRAAGRVAYSAREVQVLQVLKQRVPDGFGDLWLQTIHGYRDLFDATIETPAEAPTPPPQWDQASPSAAREAPRPSAGAHPPPVSGMRGIASLA